MVGIVPPAVSTDPGASSSASGPALRPATRDRRQRDRAHRYHRPHDIDTLLARLRRHARGQGRRGRHPVRRRASGSSRSTAGGSSMRPRRSGTAPSATAGAEIADAVAEQLKRLPAYSSFGAYTTEPTIALAERLAALAPIDDAVVFLGSGGSDAVDTAAKLARRYWDVVGDPRSGSSCRASTATTGCTPGARRSPASRATRPATAASSSTRSSTSAANDTETSRRAVRAARRRDRRLHRRAGHRRRRRLPARAVVLGRGPAALPRARRPAHRRRGHHRASGGPACCGARSATASSPT